MAVRIPFDAGAYVVRRAGRPSWYLETCVGGVQLRRSLKTSNRALALERAHAQIGQLSARAWGTAPTGAVSIREAAERYQERLRQTGHARDTEKLIRQTADKLEAFLKDRFSLSREPELRDVNADVLQEWYSWMGEHPGQGKKAPPGPVTINCHRGRARAMFNYAIRKGLMGGPNPVLATDAIRVTKRLKWIPSEAEVLRFLEEAKTPYLCVGPFGKGNGTTRERNPAFHDVAVLIANMGLRFSEALALEWQDVNTTGGHCKGGTLYVRSKEENLLKDREERAVPLNDAVRAMLLGRRQLVPAGCTWVFPNTEGRPHNADTFRRDWKAIGAKAKLPKLTPQALRRFYGTMQAQAGVPAFILKAWMGHSSVTTTEQHYIGGGADSAWRPANVSRESTLAAE